MWALAVQQRTSLRIEFPSLKGRAFLVGRVEAAGAGSQQASPRAARCCPSRSGSGACSSCQTNLGRSNRARGQALAMVAHENAAATVAVLVHPTQIRGGLAGVGLGARIHRALRTCGRAGRSAASELYDAGAGRQATEAVAAVVVLRARRSPALAKSRAALANRPWPTVGVLATAEDTTANALELVRIGAEPVGLLSAVGVGCATVGTDAGSADLRGARLHCGALNGGTTVPCAVLAGVEAGVQSGFARERLAWGLHWEAPVAIGERQGRQREGEET